MENKGIYQMSEDDFNKMQSILNLEVKITSIINGPTNRIQVKTGVEKSITYKDEMINGKTIHNYYAFVNYKDVMKEKSVQTRIVYFEFTNSESENIFLEWIKKWK